MPMPNIPFNVEIPFECFYKAGEKGKERRIGGIISTESKDRQGEVVLQRGLDFSEFLSNGWFNDNHSKDTTGIVGYPVKVEKRNVNGRTAHYVEGYLLEGHEPADKIWTLANSLQKTGRRLGFSIEGAINRRDGMDGKTIAEAKVRNVAVTNCPVNLDTGMEVLAKSLMALEAEANAEKALTAGQAVDAPPVASGQGFALRTESLESKPKKKRKLTKSEAFQFLMGRYPGMTQAYAEKIIDYVVAQSRNLAGGNDGAEATA